MLRCNKIDITKKRIAKWAIVFVGSFALFFVLTLFANKVLSAYDVTSVRLSPVLNPILSIAFGWPAAIGCALANTISDIISGFKPLVCGLGIIPQLIYGLLPYYVWKLIARSESHKTRLDSPRKVIYFALLMLFNSLIMGLFVGLFQLYTSGNQFSETFVFSFLNDFDICVVLGLPLMTLIDYIYSRNHQIRKRKISFNERIIVVCGVLEITTFVIIAASLLIANKSINNAAVWKQIFTYSIYAMNALLIASVIVMYVFLYRKKKYGTLKVIEKANGTIYVDEAKSLEFISYPNVEDKYHIISKDYRNSLELINKNYKPRYEKAWSVMLSNQKGCPMKCTFCDCPGFGFHGNISREELKYQIETIIDNVGVTHTECFNVDFMRMGEPTLNEAILPFIENDLRKIVLNKVDAEVIHPSLSTMLPRRNKDGLLNYLLDYCRIKNDVYKGVADLQFSINTTDEVIRRKIFKNMSLSLEEISELAKQMPLPKGNKYALNFAVTQDSVIEPEVLDRLFDKNKFYIKLTPIHQTFNAIDNGFVSDNETTYQNKINAIEEELSSKGWEVKIFVDRDDVDKDSLTCGNLVLANISEKLISKNTKKKKIGLCVAIEIDAIFNMYPDIKEIDSPNGFKVYYISRDAYDIYVVKTGMGEVAASAGVQYLIAKHNVSMIINFGVVGGLTEEMKKEKVCIVNQVVHYKYDCSEFMDLKVGQVDGHKSIYLKTDEKLVNNVLTLMDGVKVVTCCSGDKFISTKEEKEYLHNTFNGDICDMESSGIVLTCEMNNVPCLLFKAVSDGLNDGAEGFYAELEKASMKCLKVADIIIDKISKVE